VLALLTLVPTFARGGVLTTSLAVSVGGILLALRAFDEISVFFQQLSLAAASFEQIRHLLEAVVRPELASKIPLDMEVVSAAAKKPKRSGMLIEGRGLTFRHAGRSRAILENCSLQIGTGDRILLEGPSGGG